MISRRTSSVPKEDVVFSDCSTVSRDAPRLVAGALRCSQATRRHAPACHRHSQACHGHSQVLPGAPKVLSGAPKCSQTYRNHSHGTPVAVIRDPSSSLRHSWWLPVTKIHVADVGIACNWSLCFLVKGLKPILSDRVIYNGSGFFFRFKARCSSLHFCIYLLVAFPVESNSSSSELQRSISKS